MPERGGRPVRDRGPVDPAQLRYPEQLPVVERRDDILAAIRDHQVVVIAGETGSGKTTQLPKMCLELGLGGTGQIGHTQPRRIAARSVAERIAEEMEVELGDLVGYQVRFTDHSSDRTRVKVMTDGILLAEMQRDRDLRRYDTIIIDEAHERSLNIDFILGYLKSLLPRRPDLKVIITSATIDPGRFADHFSTDARGATVREVPIIEVSGRTYPVEVRYRPLVERDDNGAIVEERDQVTGVVEAVEELWTETPPGHLATDILVFFSGEREIRDAADALNGLNLPHTDVLPLYARLSAAEQHRVFTRGSGRRIILATNVAETSLTVPGIGYVIDTGTARISRYSQRTKVQRLPIEPISQASAAQRSGRCGRVADGVAIRLYSEEDFESRPEFTDPEIQRTSLAAVILQMTALGLGDIGRFPFVDAPDQKQIVDGVRLLDELGALRDDKGRRGERRLTAYGKTLARLPLDPRMGRMIIEAGRLGCTREVLVIVAALSIQDPRERPVDKEAQAQQQHARFKSETSDFAGFHALWRYLKEQQKALSGSAFRRMCKAEFLHYLRIREWQDLHQQLRTACKQARIDPDRSTSAKDTEPDWDVVHKALLAGLLSHVGVRDEQRREYAGARGSRFGINPGSGLFKKQPDVVMAAELVETTRLWARVNAAIDPEWAEEVGAHVVKRTYSEPRWSKSQGSVVASERVTLYGVPLIVDRTVQYGRINPEEARELFIRHALVEGDWDTHHKFWKANAELLQRLSELEERARRRDLIVDDEVVFSFYDARVPPDVTSARHFDRWWRGEHRRRPDLLTFTEELLTRDDVDAVSAQDYPRTWQQGDLDLDVTYQFSPGDAADGVTVHVPTAILNRVTAEGFDWQVPGLREDLAIALLKSLPKATRRHFVPTPDHARAALAGADRASGASLTDDLARVLKDRTGVSIGAGEWDWARVPDHLRITFSVEAPGGRVIARGKDLDELRPKSQGAVRQRMARAGASIERTGLTDWTMDDVPRTFEGRSAGHTVQGFPALVDEGASVALRVLDHAGSATAAHRAGVRRLLLLNTTAPWKRVLARLSNAQKLALGQNPHGSVPALLEDCLAAAVDSIVAEHVPAEVRTRAEYDTAHAAVRTHVVTRVLQVIEAVEPVLALAGDVRRRLDALGTSAARQSLAVTLADVRAQLDGLIRPGFVADSGLARLPHLQRYLRAMLQRLERAATNAREAQLQAQIDGIETAYADLLDALPATDRRAPEVTDVAWQIEELRVSLFAQSLGTAHPVSEKRVRAAIATLIP
ncbi:ATP-dependent RNA helicase HrpA [Knoellia subterranea]|uniref:ATP-dependent helicase n=1 Tax=Knoellia subterranea KCTC 19937 TaxID=1385521 RepID=A0A0A0JGN8_9MICO|nr:ATP-dependent RNA helicase HrpA [Knoellia subterranea]KGN36313.1 ATP-dependent helicase [Knoellia subterranea KCTC 19937]